MKMITELRAERIPTWILWIIALACTLVAFWPLVGIGLIGDDLYVVTDGASVIRSSGIGEFVGTFVQGSISGSHVLPLGGFVAALFVTLVDFVAQLGLGLAAAWEAGRVAALVIALMMTSAATWTWMRERYSSTTGVNGSRGFVLTYCLTAAIFIAGLQIHGAWSQDPVLAYSLASWGTVALSFALLMLLGFVWWSSQRLARLALLGIAVLAVAGVLYYEMFLAAIAATVAGALVAVMLNARDPGSWRKLTWVIVALVPSGLVLLASQVIRSSQPETYSGTQFGYSKMILPVWMNGVVGNIPLTNVPLTSRIVGDQAPQALDIALPALGVLGLLLVALPLLRQLTSDSMGGGITQNHRPAGWMVPVVFGITLWLFSALIFSASAKYQIEVGLEIGRTYLFYSMGWMAIASILAIVILGVRRPKTVGGGIAVIAIALMLGVAQWFTNAKSLNSLRENGEWSRELLASIDAYVPEPARCGLLRTDGFELLPLWYRAGLASHLNIVYQDRYREDFCSTFEAPVFEGDVNS